LPTFDAESNVTVSSFQPAQIPVRTRGFWAVLGITAAHFVLCLIALVGFISSTYVSSLKNAWQVMADISESPETAAILRKVGVKNDGQVAECIEKDESLRHRRFRLRGRTDSTEWRAASSYKNDGNALWRAPIAGSSLERLVAVWQYHEAILEVARSDSQVSPLQYEARCYPEGFSLALTQVSGDHKS